MYKTVNISADYYRQLDTIAVSVKKPKKRIVEALIASYANKMKVGHDKGLEEFNRKMQKQIDSLRLSREIKINTEELDKMFSSLKPTDF